MKIDLGDAPRAARPYVERDGATVTLHFEESQVQTRLSLTEPDALLVPYTRTMMGFRLFVPAPARVLLIGLGGGAIARHLVATLPDAELVAIEISPEVLALREALLVPLDGPRFAVVQDDGAAYVQRCGGFDVILVDGFDVGGQAPSLCTPGFYADCRARLGESGVLVVNVNAHSSANGRYVRRIRDVFGGRLIVVPSEDEQNKVVFAWRGAIEEGEIAARGAALGLSGLADAVVAARAHHAG